LQGFFFFKKMWLIFQKKKIMAQLSQNDTFKDHCLLQQPLGAHNIHAQYSITESSYSPLQYAGMTTVFEWIEEITAKNLILLAKIAGCQPQTWVVVPQKGKWSYDFAKRGCWNETLTMFFLAVPPDIMIYCEKQEEGQLQKAFLPQSVISKLIDCSRILLIGSNDNNRNAITAEEIRQYAFNCVLAVCESKKWHSNFGVMQNEKLQKTKDLKIFNNLKQKFITFCFESQSGVEHSPYLLYKKIQDIRTEIMQAQSDCKSQGPAFVDLIQDVNKCYEPLADYQDIQMVATFRCAMLRRGENAVGLDEILLQVQTLKPHVRREAIKLQYIELENEIKEQIEKEQEAKERENFQKIQIELQKVIPNQNALNRYFYLQKLKDKVRALKTECKIPAVIDDCKKLRKEIEMERNKMIQLCLKNGVWNIAQFIESLDVEHDITRGNRFSSFSPQLQRLLRNTHEFIQIDNTQCTNVLVHSMPHISLYISMVLKKRIQVVQNTSISMFVLEKEWK
jgi:hypothetical protein